jgi:hypothetical protein
MHRAELSRWELKELGDVDTLTDCARYEGTHIRTRPLAAKFSIWYSLYYLCVPLVFLNKLGTLKNRAFGAIFDLIQTRGAVRSSEPATVNGTTAIRIANATAGAAGAIATREDALDYDSDELYLGLLFIMPTVDLDLASPATCHSPDDLSRGKSNRYHLTVIHKRPDHPKFYI